MKKKIIAIVLSTALVFIFSLVLTGCDKPDAETPTDTGEKPVSTEEEPFTTEEILETEDGEPIVTEEEPVIIEEEPEAVIDSPLVFNSIEGSTITNFKAGKIKEDSESNLYVFEETLSIPMKPGTFFGVSFDYKSNSGEVIEYLEVESFPKPPQNWVLWEGSDGSYEIFEDDARAEFKTTLPPDGETFISYWGFNPSGDPIGKWVWEIYFNGELYTTVDFDIVGE